MKGACKEVAKETMTEASVHIHKIKSVQPSVITDVAVSCDGSWQRRGFSSMNGFVSAISMDNGKVCDIETMTRYCRSCQMHESLKHQDKKAYDD